MGGGSGSHTTEYEPERVGPARRKYGERPTTFKGQDDYEWAVNQVNKGAYIGTKSKYRSKETDTLSSINYDPTYQRYTLDDGTDLKAAITDWENYINERSEIAVYEASEARRKEAPESLTGTSGNVDYSLSINQEEDDENRTSTISSTTVDISPTTASTNQSLGIY